MATLIPVYGGRLTVARSEFCPTGPPNRPAVRPVGLVYPLATSITLMPSDDPELTIERQALTQ